VRHVRAAHSKRGLPRNPTPQQIDAWVEQIAACVRLHCPHVREKVTIEAHRYAVLLPPLTELLATATGPGDTIYQLLTRRGLDYGLTRAGQLVSLFSRQVKDDLWDVGNDRKMDAWPAQGMQEMAPHQCALAARHAARARKARRAATGVRKTAPIERRPPQVRHTYRYQLHPAATA
jgi:hypothetical protein